ncbi:MAG TPA: hypothetical protein VFX59_04545 [Polyangiales bacterium]|nr:hypothetical protein [Polyangiales bacterium]
MGNSTRVMLLAVMLGGCASAPATPINSVARGDLACEQVNVNEVADNRYQAVGCGRTGTYAQLCSGRNCSWVRVRSATEVQQGSGGYAAAASSYGQRQIIPAPPPEQREVIQAPPPAQPQPREIIQAPPPETQATTDSAAPQQVPYTPQPTPLSQGDLSQPYETEVPLEPTVQRVQYPPPAPIVEVRPAPPQPSYVWVSGYWWWNQPAWTWAPGYWCAPRYGYNYIASSWYWNSGYWYFGAGGWARPGSTLIVGSVGPRPSRYVTSRSFTPHYVSSGGRMGTGPAYSSGPARAPQRYAPQQSPLYHYPTSSSQRMGRMGAGSMGGPARSGGYNGVSSSPSPGRFGAGSPTTSSRNYGYQPGRMGGNSGMRMGGSPSPGFQSAPSSSPTFRSAPMMRGPSSSPSRFGGGGGFNRGGGGGFGGGGFRSGGGGGFNRGGGGGFGGGGRMGGGGGGPHSSPGGRR